MSRNESATRHFGGSMAGFAASTPDPRGIPPKSRQNGGIEADLALLMVVSDSLTYGDVFGALDGVSRTLGRHVNPTVYTAAEFSKRARTENAFVTRVLEGPKVWVIGSDHDLSVAA